MAVDVEQDEGRVWMLSSMRVEAGGGAGSLGMANRLVAANEEVKSVGLAMAKSRSSGRRCGLESDRYPFI